MFNTLMKQKGRYLFFIALLITPALQAADFTFSVPINFSNLEKSIHKVRVQCAVYLSRKPAPSSRVIKQEKIINVNNGAISQTIKIGLNFPQSSGVVSANLAGKTIHDVRSWDCKSEVCRPGHGGLKCERLRPKAGDISFRSKPGKAPETYRTGIF